MKIPETIKKFLRKIQTRNDLTIHLSSFRDYTFYIKGIAGALIVLFILFFGFILKNTPKSQHLQNHYQAKAVASLTGDVKNIRKSLSALNAASPLDLSYHKEVAYYVELYLNERRSQLEQMVSQSEIYFPIIESTLDKYELPLELKYVAVLESGLNPLARSKSGAVGLWQFLYNTCALVDLEVTSYIDERRDIYKSTDAACRYLKYLYRIYEDWNLALASYNGGPGEVRKAIERSGGKTNYWEIRPFLSNQAANYVPAFIAFNYLLAFSKELNVEYKKPPYMFSKIDTIYLNSSASLAEISKALNIPFQQLLLLNPVYKKDVIPFSSHHPVLVLPKSKISSFFQFEQKIYTNSTNSVSSRPIRVNHPDIHNKTCISYIVKEGDFFHKLAMQHNCTIENIKAWNKLTTTNLVPGQKLKIYVNSEPALVR